MNKPTARKVCKDYLMAERKAREYTAAGMEYVGYKFEGVRDQLPILRALNALGVTRDGAIIELIGEALQPTNGSR